MKLPVFIITFLLLGSNIFSQVSINTIKADYVTGSEREKFKTFLFDTVIKEALTMPLDSDGEYGYETACLSASQFMIQCKELENGFKTIINQYNSLQFSTKLAFMEAVYGLYPGKYAKEINKLIVREKQPKLFAMQATYLLETDRSPKNRTYLLALLARLPGNGKNEVLLQLRDYLINHQKYIGGYTPPIADLFGNQRGLRQKIIYSFQRWNRDYPGLAIVQNADGTFAKDSTGKLFVFRQLARSADNMPYFITDGNTPQGIYSITGLGVSHSHFLGPTPNIQMLLPFENDQAYWGDTYNDGKDPLGNYLSLLPASWQNYQPIKEAFYAGKAGRSAIICHGTTLNPFYFAGRPYYPISPTLGCLCAREVWDTATGKLQESDQLGLVNAFLSTPGDTGLVMVVNLDNKQLPISTEEIARLVKNYEEIAAGH